MREEIAAAVLFIGRIVGEADSATSEDKVHKFTSNLSKILEERFQGHWHTDKPTKGQGYRSIRIHPAEPLDPVLERAAADSGLSLDILFIPVELTLWVDPQEVCCRFGDLKATYCTVLTYRGGNMDNKVSTLDVRDLLDTAKAQYSRQQHIRVFRNSPPPGHRSQTPNTNHYSYGMPNFGSPGNGLHMYGYVEGYVPETSVYSRNGEDGGMNGLNGFMNGFHNPPPVSSQYQPSFTATAVNTTPRKNGKGGNPGHFRKNNGSGRGAKLSQNGDAGQYSHNHHNNNLNNNGSTTSNGSARSNADRYHWVRNKQQQQTPASKESK